MRNHHRAFVTAAALLCAAGCDMEFVGPTGTLDWGGFTGGSINYPLTLTGIPNFLSGDSVRVSVWSSTSNTQSRWEITGPAVFVIDRDSVATRITSPVSDVWIRGTGSGAVTIKAVRYSGIDSANTSFFVADPAEVALRVVQGRELTIRVGGEGWMVAYLVDNQSLYYAAAFVWSSSDTTAVTLKDDVHQSQGVKIARGRAVGSSKIVVAFREQRDTARVTVTP